MTASIGTYCAYRAAAVSAAPHPRPRPGAEDGVWWPRSRDFALEAADLVDHFPQQFGQVYRVVFSRPDWDSVPHRLKVHVA